VSRLSPIQELDEKRLQILFRRRALSRVSRIAASQAEHRAMLTHMKGRDLPALEETIRERLSTVLGDGAPKRLRFAPGRLPERAGDAPESAPPPCPPVVGEEARRRGEELARLIEDDELRALVARAAAASLARAETRPDDRPL